MKTKPQCLKCSHYFATYDQTSPRGCKAYGFRSSAMPSAVIKRETGSECLKFELGAKHKKKQSESLKDSYYWKK